MQADDQKKLDSTSRARPRRRTAGRLVRLCLKELRETLRDRRTIVTLVLMPLMVYPLLAILFSRLQASSQDQKTTVRCIVGLESEADARIAESYLIQGGNALIKRDLDGPPDPKLLPPEEAEQIQWVIGKDLRGKVSDGHVDVALLIHRETQNVGKERKLHFVKFELVYRENSVLGKAGVEFIEERLAAFNEQFYPGGRAPTSTEHNPLERPSPLTTLIPLILILMTITGAVYPAIDLTAGERERGTLETLMAAPVPRLGLLTAKYVAVVAVAMLTATANLLAMSITIVATGLGGDVFGESGLTLGLVGQVFALLIVFAAFFSAILLALTSFARSFKEAQAYLIPVMLLALAPGVMSLMPELRFNGVLSVTPLVNIVLLARDVFEGQVDVTLAAAAVLSTAIYTLAAITIAARIFGTDAILYGSQASWSDLLIRSDRRRGKPSVAGAMICLALMFPSYFVLSNSLHRITWISPALRLILSAAVTALLFAGLPLIVGSVQNVLRRDAFRLHGSHVLAFLATIILGVSLWPMAHEIFLMNEFLGLSSLSEERIQAAQKLLDSWRDISPLLILFTLAVTPAICEEFFFRGYLFSAFRGRFSPTLTILITAALFGIFHVVVTSSLAVERMLPSTFMGLILGWVCWRTGSVLPGMLLHASHNGLLLMIACYRDELLARGWGVAEESHLPLNWLLASALGVAVGLSLLWFTTSPEQPARASLQKAV